MTSLEIIEAGCIGLLIWFPLFGLKFEIINFVLSIDSLAESILYVDTFVNASIGSLIVSEFRTVPGNFN